MDGHVGEDSGHFQGEGSINLRGKGTDLGIHNAAEASIFSVSRLLLPNFAIKPYVW